MRLLLIFIASFLSSQLATATCGNEIEISKPRPRLASKVREREVQTEFRILNGIAKPEVVASNSLYEVLSGGWIRGYLSVIALRSKASGKIIALADVGSKSGWTARSDDYVFSKDGTRLLLGGPSRMEVVRIPSLENELDLHATNYVYIYGSKAWSENLNLLFTTAKAVPSTPKGSGRSINMYALNAKPREIWVSKNNEEVNGPLVWNDKTKTLHWKTTDGQSWVFNKEHCSTSVSGAMPMVAAENPVDTSVIETQNPLSPELEDGWLVSSLIKEPSQDTYFVSISRDKIWKEIRFDLAGAEVANLKKTDPPEKDFSIDKNYWYSGPAKLIESENGLQFFQTPQSKPLKLITYNREPDQDPHWVIMAESKNAIVARRLDDYGDGQKFYIPKRQNGKGRRLNFSHRLPIDPLMRFDLRLDDVMVGSRITAIDLKSGKVLGSGTIPLRIDRRTVAISHNGNQLITYGGPFFLVVNLNGGKKIEVGAPSVFRENGLPVNIAGATFANDGRLVVISNNGTLHIYKR